MRMRRAPTLATLVMLLLTTGCATGRSPASPEAAVRRCTSCTFQHVLFAVANAVTDMDAELLEYTMNAEERTADLSLLPDWRTPSADSAVLVLHLAEREGGFDLAVVPDVLATRVAARRRELKNDPENQPGVSCSACEQRKRDIRAAYLPMSNARALANMRRAVETFLALYDRRMDDPPPPVAGDSGLR